MMDPDLIKAVSMRLLEPYTIPADCPYLSEDQRDLSEMDLEKRSEWMGEWLRAASGTQDDV